MSLQVALPALGLSLVNQVREELLYLSLVKPLFDYIRSENIENIHLSIRHVQLDNQLVDTTFPITIYSQTNKQRAQSSKARAAAVDVDCQHVLGSNSSMHVFKLLTVQMAPFSLDIDEILLMKVIEMFTANRNKEEESELSVIQPSKDKDFDITVRKYYFALLSVVCGQMTLSVHTAKLPQHLKDVKKAMAMSSMITFENAVIDFEPFLQLHPFESLNFMLTAIGTHFKQELQGQAAKIFGAVDVLGNPLGLVNDVTTGISGLVTDGNVGMLLKNVTHGASNSLAKVAGTLSQGLGRISMDANHEEHRDQIRRQYAGSNVLLGFKSLAHGIIGGITSLAQQTLEGASQDGLEGMFTGFGKGVVGTVTKPVVGVLDFASGAATAIRDTSGGGGGIHTIQRKRKPRCCYSRHGLLPVYSSRSATGQQVLLFLNGDSKTQERYIDHIRLTNQPEPHHMLVSDQAVYLLNMNRPQEEPSLLVSLSDLLSCIYVRKERADGSIQHYIEVKWKRLSESGGSHYKTSTSTVRCETSEVAEQVVILIDHARGLYNEKLHTVLAT
ncbi:hypothetical protein EB796_019947 [Bugula neritina]|uniref:Intermembrane lipid transfer protein VPS13-like C-terminal domain-containing protein n=1 Tax=Bugula neritina TaxID=10212 RepID=A0A7J7J6G9_BUGNE|nr:hypothetical protein EB796_019947 [Bugula neritina]